MEKLCSNAYDAASQHQGWQWWLPLALYVWEHLESGAAVCLCIWAWEQGIVNLSQEQSQEYWKQEIRVVRQVSLLSWDSYKIVLQVTWISKIWKGHVIGRSLSLLSNPYVKHK